MGKERPTLGLDDDEISITELVVKKKAKKDKIDKSMVRKISELSGFPSREKSRDKSRDKSQEDNQKENQERNQERNQKLLHAKTRLRKRSPFTEQLGLKCRPAIRELFYDLGYHLDLYDHTVFEKALLALIEKEGTDEQIKTYKAIVE